MRQYLNMLGLRVRDRVTGVTGVVTSVSFDLYGCVQCIVDAPVDEKGERKAHWYDYKRLEVLDSTPVMQLPVWEEPGSERGGFESQPIHATDRDQALKQAELATTLIAEPSESEEVCISMSGSLTRRGTYPGEHVIVGASINAYAYLATKQ